MKEELTTKMHNELRVSEKDDLKHRCFSALECMNDFDYSIEDAAEIYNVTIFEINKYRSAFKLFSE